MHAALSSKVVNVGFAEAILDNASLTTAEIDTLGADYCKIYVRLGTTDIAMAALKVQESDTSGSGFADIDATDFSDATQTDMDGNALGLPAATDDDTFFVICVDCRARKRYLDLVATAGNGTAGSWIFAWAELFRLENGPNTSAEMGADTVVIV